MAVAFDMDSICEDSSEKELYLHFLALHESQLQSSSVPTIFWYSLWTKLKNQVLDAGECFSINQVEYEDDESGSASSAIGWEVVVSSTDGINPKNPNHIFLVDHAWTYTSSQAKDHLLTNEFLLHRMAALMAIPTTELSKDEIVGKVIVDMWRYNQTYSLNLKRDDEPAPPVWYILDEFGSRIQHSDEPNFCLVPFYYVPHQMSYSLLFPVKDVEYGELVTRNYVEGPRTDRLTYVARKLPWEPADFTDIDFNHEEVNEEFIQGGRVEETLPDIEQPKDVPIKEKYKVFSEYKYVEEYLHHANFEIIFFREKADVLWLNTHFKHYRELQEGFPTTLINQFPCEHILTVKDLLATTCKRAAHGKSIDPITLQSYPVWLPTTYNLMTELPKFVSYFQHRKNHKLDNTWIIKPFNLARGIDIHITNDLNHIIRLRETGPKIACKYITDPVLFPRDEIGMVKFDIRYIILLRSISPLKVYAYKRFWLRFANRSFELKDFDDYEKHFTVMNYVPANLKQMYCDEFIERFESHYPAYRWKDIEEKLFKMLRDVFEAATSRPPPCGLHNNPQSRAMYAADIMLEWDRDKEDDIQVQPKLLEINWAPDCQRACEYYPEFFNDVFSVLVLDDVNGKHVQLL